MGAIALFQIVETAGQGGDSGVGLAPGVCFLDAIQSLADLVQAGALAVLDVVEPTGETTQRLLDLGQVLGCLGPSVLFEPAEALVSLLQLVGDIVDAAAIGSGLLVLRLHLAHQTGDGLIHALDGDGRAALGGFQTGGDGVDRGGDPMQRLIIAPEVSPVAAVRQIVGVVDAARTAPTINALGGVRTARQRRYAVVLVVHDHGVEPFAQRHARTARQILGHLARLGIDPLDAPRRCGCAH